MSYFTVDPSKMQDLAKSVQGDDTKKDFGTWLKLHVGDNVLRICPPWSKEGSPFRELLSHNGPFKSPFVNDDGKRVAPLCYRFLTKDPNLTEIALDAGKIKEADLELIKEFGCPLCELPKHLQAVNKDAAREHWPRRQFIWNVINREDGKLYKWSCSKKIATPIQATFNLYHQLFDPEEGRDLTITATGEQLSRRYDPPVFNPFNSPLDYSGDLNDLDEVMNIGIREFNTMVSLALNNNQDHPLSARLSEGLIEYASGFSSFREDVQRALDLEEGRL